MSFILSRLRARRHSRVLRRLRDLPSHLRLDVGLPAIDGLDDEQILRRLRSSNLW